MMRSRVLFIFVFLGLQFPCSIRTRESWYQEKNSSQIEPVKFEVVVDESGKVIKSETPTFKVPIGSFTRFKVVVTLNNEPVPVLSSTWVVDDEILDALAQTVGSSLGVIKASGTPRPTILDTQDFGWIHANSFVAVGVEAVTPLGLISTGGMIQVLAPQVSKTFITQPIPDIVDDQGTDWLESTLSYIATFSSEAFAGNAGFIQLIQAFTQRFPQDTENPIETLSTNQKYVLDSGENDQIFIVSKAFIPGQNTQVELVDSPGCGLILTSTKTSITYNHYRDTNNFYSYPAYQPNVNVLPYVASTFAVIYRPKCCVWLSIAGATFNSQYNQWDLDEDSAGGAQFRGDGPDWDVPSWISNFDDEISSEAWNEDQVSSITELKKSE